MESPGCINDDSFGPAVEGCRGDFDFTIKFEKIFFTLVPTAIFMLICIPRVIHLVQSPVIVDGKLFQTAKLTAVGGYGAIQLALLMLSTIKSRELQADYISTSAVTFASVLCMLVISHLEHARSPRPAILLDAYLFLTILLDITQTRTLWLTSVTFDGNIFSRLFTAGVVVKALLMVLESRHKTRWLRWDTQKHSPEEMSGLYSIGAFAWLNQLFLTGYGKVLTLDDLYPLDQNMAAEFLQTKLANVTEAAGNHRYGLAISTLKALAFPFLLPVVPRIAMGVFQFCQPLLFNSLLQYLELPAEESSRNHGYGLIGATGLVYLGIATSTSFYWYFQERTMYMLRGVLAGTVYQTATRAKLSAANDFAALTLMSTDVERIIRGLLSIHELWASPIEVAVASCLLYRQIGISFVAPLVVIGCCVGLVSFLTRFTGPRQKAWMEQIQNRVGLTSVVIGQMKELKISGLAGPIGESIQQMRVDELKTGARFRILTTWSVIIGFTPVFISPLLAFAFTGRTLDVTVIFTSMSYLLLLASPLTTLFQLIPGFSFSVTCLARIQEFLSKDPRVDFRIPAPHCLGENTMASDSEKTDEVVLPGSAVNISAGNFGWEADNFALNNINLEIAASRLTLVVGPVASGKSTLCKVLLGEVPFAQGNVSISRDLLLGKSGFCDQTPYLLNTTIRENIVAFSAFDEARYSEVLEASMLLPDLAVLPLGDQTRVGSKGISLSGGQRARVCIARALYLDSSFLVFDDILSGLDADTEQEVFRRILSPSGLLRRRNATVVLCTHSVKHLPFADHIIVLGSKGTIVQHGTFRDLMDNPAGYIHSLGIKDNSTEPFDDGATPSVPNARPSLERRHDLTAEMREPSRDEGPRRILKDGTVYRHYFSRISAWNIAAIGLFSMGWGFFANFNVIWLKFWSADVASANPAHSNAFYIGIYAIFQISALACLFVVCVVVLIVAIQVTGAKLHKEALATVINAPLRFFTSTDTGVVTNLFSQDITLIDGALPLSLLNISISIPDCIGVAAVIASSSPFLTITYPFLAAIIFYVQKFYLRTSTQLRLLDLEAKSPLYTHFIDTIRGIASVRAFRWTNDCIALNNSFLDTSQRPAYLLAIIQRWLAFTLRLVVAGLALVFVALATQLRFNSAITGASLVTLMTFGEQLSFLVETYTMLETSIGAVSRLKTFSDEVTPEKLQGEDVVPPLGWPLKGRIEISGVSVSYDDMRTEVPNGTSDSGRSRHLTLDNLTLSIKPREKVAICGRSGSGKSTTILLLLKILDPLPSTQNGIAIDSTPLHKIDRVTLRQRIIAIPQEPVFLPDGTSFQANLDPFGTSTELDCRSVLEVVHLWSFVAERGGLTAGIVSDSLSAGQKQLFSLARAVLRARLRAREPDVGSGQIALSTTSGGILLLDEVTSNVDYDTDIFMQSIIRAEFKNYTILMVSHRLQMIMDFDTVVVMDKGKAIEIGPPKELLEREGGSFRKLCLAHHHRQM